MASRIEGAERLTLAFRTLPRNLRRKVNRQAVAAGARVIAKATKKEAPRRTGRLKRSIRIQRDKRSRGGAIVRYLIGPTRDGFHGVFIALGTKFIPKNPFMERGFDRSKREAIRKTGQIWGKGVEREILKLAGPRQRRR